ncbi:uncharacterized protein LOC132395122 [Hypanus sabinus]|uniref:uncharacterized protein LOC132395122 n=1 Tax=Hypanus sabinus TaxID=79690 RepID=UPI0028C3BE5A|nr:uncharacterized protein LOC132395122 [Hypanus sabinus]
MTDFRRRKLEVHEPVLIRGGGVERVSNFKLPGVVISENWSRAQHVSGIMKKAWQCLYFLKSLQRFGMTSKTLTNFYRCVVESILTGCITAWYGNTNALEWKILQKVVDTAHTIRSKTLPTIEQIYTEHCCRKAAVIIRGPQPPGHALLSLLPSGAPNQQATLSSRCCHQGPPTTRPHSLLAAAIRGSQPPGYALLSLLPSGAPNHQSTFSSRCCHQGPPTTRPRSLLAAAIRGSQPPGYALLSLLPSGAPNHQAVLSSRCCHQGPPTTRPCSPLAAAIRGPQLPGHALLSLLPSGAPNHQAVISSRCCHQGPPTTRPCSPLAAAIRGP